MNSKIYKLSLNTPVKDPPNPLIPHAQTPYIPVFKEGPGEAGLLLNSNNKQVVLLKLTKTGEIEKKIPIQDFMKFLIDYCPYADDGIARIARDGRIKLFEVEYKTANQEYVAAMDLPLIDKRGESPFKIVSDLEGEYFAVHLQDDKFNASRVLLYHLDSESGKMSLKADCDIYQENLARFFGMSFVRNYGGKVNLVAISNAKSATQILSFEFDVKASYLREVRKMRKTMKLEALQGFRRIGDMEFVAADVYGGVLKVSYQEI